LYEKVMTSIHEDQEFKSIRVVNPENKQGVIFYNVCAFDKEGEFNCTRRYSDFECLREAWRKKVPGLFFPFLPPKKFFGNTEKSHVEERRFLLEQFIRKIHNIPYLKNSQEYSVFARHRALD